MQFKNKKNVYYIRNLQNGLRSHKKSNKNAFTHFSIENKN